MSANTKKQFNKHDVYGNRLTGPGTSFTFTRSELASSLRAYRNGKLRAVVRKVDNGYTINAIQWVSIA